jgi:hypothetical protein
MNRAHEVDIGAALSAHLAGLLCGVATIVGLIPAMVASLRLFE